MLWTSFEPLEVKLKANTNNMEIKRTPKGYLLRLDQGDELFASLSSFVDIHKIESGNFSGIGTISELDLSFYNSETKQYETKTVNETLEVASLSGNCALNDGAPFFHAHGVFSKRDCSTIGGHVQRAITAMTMELFFVDFETNVDRNDDPETGLKLLSF